MPRKVETLDPTIDTAVEILLEQADEIGISTAFSRAEVISPCHIDKNGKCCKKYQMGPCRLVKPGQRGECGAILKIVAARTLARGLAAALQLIRIMAWVWPLAQVFSSRQIWNKCLSRL